MSKLEYLSFGNKLFFGGCIGITTKGGNSLIDVSMGIYEEFGIDENEAIVIVDISDQCLYLMKAGVIEKKYLISSSKYGVGSEKWSNRTPLGTHSIIAKVGKGAKLGTIFKGQRNTGEISKIYNDETKLKEDLITTRIIILDGMRDGVNKGLGVDSRARGIYIHGTPEEGRIGQPASFGCIRMKNKDVVEFFNMVKKGTIVEIQE